MAIAPERSRPLHNFTLPRLRWGNQKLLRCMNLAGDGLQSSQSDVFNPNRAGPTNELFNRRSTHQTVNGNGIEAVREKLMLDLRVAADKMKVSMMEENESDESTRPWNLRTRRSACRAPEESPAPPQSPAETLKSTRLRGLAATATGERAGRRKFSVSLSKEEVERDFLAMAGVKPPRRPKKRAKIVQNQINVIFPGLWLTEVTPDMYKVIENPEQKKA